jgi:hypothetical protein
LILETLERYICIVLAMGYEQWALQEICKDLHIATRSWTCFSSSGEVASPG